MAIELGLLVFHFHMNKIYICEVSEFNYLRSVI